MPLYAFDGTWSSRRADDPSTPEIEANHNTNVVRFLDAYDDSDSFYVEGVGADADGFSKILSGVFGVGGQERLADAMAHLRHRFAAGEREVDVVGFSRGGALALAFANRIAADVELRDLDGQAPRVRFVGVFDVVGSFGIPFNVGPIKCQEYNLGYPLTLPSNVDDCFHAMALDERRQTFRVTRIKGAYEVWFRGAHSDVGGGNGNIGLNSIASRWMLRKAEVCGLPIRHKAIASANVGAMPLAPVLWPDDLLQNDFRQVDHDDLVHYTVMRPCLNSSYNQPPPSCPTEDIVQELTARIYFLAAR
jgi:uncharacterized protein (DUF2235 family)